MPKAIIFFVQSFTCCKCFIKKRREDFLPQLINSKTLIYLGIGTGRFVYSNCPLFIYPSISLE
jgi:hypothetical protein